MSGASVRRRSATRQVATGHPAAAPAGEEPGLEQRGEDEPGDGGGDLHSLEGAHALGARRHPHPGDQGQRQGEEAPHHQPPVQAGGVTLTHV